MRTLKTGSQHLKTVYRKVFKQKSVISSNSCAHFHTQSSRLSPNTKVIWDLTKAKQDKLKALLFGALVYPVEGSPEDLAKILV